VAETSDKGISDFRERCAGDVLKSCKRTGRAGSGSPPSERPGGIPRPGACSVWQILQVNFKLD